MKNYKNKTELIDRVGFKKYFRGETWQDYNRQFFDGLATKYDASNVFHAFGLKRYFDKKALTGLTAQNGSQILDVCCGSGDICSLLTEQFPRTHITGLDYSIEMLKIAQQRLEKFPNIELIEGDCLNLPFENSRFDGCTISYGLRNLADIEAGLKEIYRVLRNDAFFCCIDLGRPTNPFFKPIYRLHFYHIAPLIGKLIFHRNEFNSFRYLPESNFYFPPPQELKILFEKAGFRNVTVKSLFFASISCLHAVK